MASSDQSRPADAATFSGNVIKPKVFQWSKPDLVRHLVRLSQNPCPAQLDIFRRNIEDYQTKRDLDLLPFDLFALLFKDFLSRLPSLPPLTEEQHLSLYSQLILLALELASEWTDAVRERLVKGITI